MYVYISNAEYLGEKLRLLEVTVSNKVQKSAFLNNVIQ